MSEPVMFQCTHRLLERVDNHIFAQRPHHIKEASKLSLHRAEKKKGRKRKQEGKNEGKNKGKNKGEGTKGKKQR